MVVFRTSGRDPNQMTNYYPQNHFFLRMTSANSKY